MYRIGLCGAHGTGKTTLGKIISENFHIPFLTNTMRSMWQELSIGDFEKLPPDVRSSFQKHAIIRQIQREDVEGKGGFITDRTVLDNLAYTKLSADMTGIDLDLYEKLVSERLKNYSHFIYLPVMFDAPQEALRANIATRSTLAEIIETYLSDWLSPEKYLVVTNTDMDKRIAEVTDFLKK